MNTQSVKIAHRQMSNNAGHRQRKTTHGQKASNSNEEVATNLEAVSAEPAPLDLPLSSAACESEPMVSSQTISAWRDTAIATNFNLSRRGLLTLAGASTGIAMTGGSFGASLRSKAKLFMTDVGTGKNLMLLHGWTCDSHDWSWQLPVLESRYRVVAVDLRGHGRSEIMPSGSYTPADYVADIEALISNTYSGQQFIIIGHSMGAQIAARLAARRPDLVSAVVSIDGSLGFSSDLAATFEKTDLDLTTGNPGVVGPALFQLFYDPVTDPAFKRWHARRLQGMPSHVVQESFGPLFLGADQVGLGEASGAFCRSLTLPFYHLCRDPDQAARMRSWLLHPKAKVDQWQNAGHWIMQDRNTDVNAAVTAWIDAL